MQRWLLPVPTRLMRSSQPSLTLSNMCASVTPSAAGTSYIPGTETCLRFSGLVRMRVFAEGQTSRLVGNVGVPNGVFVNSGGDSYQTSYRGRLTIDAKSDTELGEL